MKIKKRVAGLLACIMLIGNTNVMANMQDRLPQDGISPIKVSHGENAATGDIIPQAQITFKKASNSDTSGEVDDYESEAEFYTFILEDSVGNKITSNRVPKDPSTADVMTENIEKHLADVNAFKNGALYKVAVKPGHFHQSTGGNVTEAPLSNASTDPVRYFLTDFNTIIKEEEDELNVYWEYIPGAEYQLVYIDKETSTKDGVDGKDTTGASGVGTRIITVRDDEAEIVTKNGVKMVKCTIPDTIAGQKYSAYVMVSNISSSFLKVNFDDVDRNIDTPKIVQATKSVSLQVSNIGKDRIRLKWALGSWADSSNLQKTKIYRKIDGEANFTNIGTLNNTVLNPKDPGKFEHDEPKKKATYYVEFTFRGDKGEYSITTKYVDYTPYELRDQPLKPKIPSLFTGSVAEEKKKEDYLVSGDNISEQEMKDNTFHLLSKVPIKMQLVWDPKKNESDKIDYSLAYDIWITDRQELLEDEEFKPVIENFRVTASDTDQLIFKEDGKTVVGLKTQLDEYRNQNGEIKKLVSNNTYYIKLVAKREYGEDDFSRSQPETAVFAIDKNGDIFKPPVLSKPPLRVKPGSVTNNSATIEWREKWYEIKAMDVTRYTNPDEKFFAELWNSKVYTGGSQTINFINNEALKEHILLEVSDLDKVKEEVNKKEPFDSHYYSRQIALGSDIKYEVKTIPYDEVIQKINLANKNNITTKDAITIEKWIMENERDTIDGWNTISPEEANEGWKEHNVTGLQPNTRYFILIRTYRELDTNEKLIQSFPSFVIVTTNSDYISEEPIPTVPNLSAEGKTDSSISVSWIYDKNFDYEIHYGRLDAPDSATNWEFTISDNPGDENYVAHQSKAVVTITGLASDTSYNVWIRAKQKQGGKVSSWSNPVTITTDKLGTPSVPKGLGKASYQSILEAGQDFVAVGADYITVEWSKIPADMTNSTDTSATDRVYTYILEYADNLEFMDSVTVDVNANNAQNATVLSKTLVKCSGLEANKPYFFRVKAVMTYTNPETKVVVTLESAFCNTVRIYTTTSSGEYDGGENENVVTFDKPIDQHLNNGIWTYEILDVAKVTSEILSKKQYYYTIKMENYNNKYDVNTRRIKMPKTVLDTVIKNGMAIKIVTNRGIYDIPGKALKNHSSKYNAKDIVQIDLTRMDYSDLTSYIRTYPENYLTGEKLEVRIKGVPVSKFDDAIKVSLRLAVTGSYNYSNFTTYQYHYNVGNWEKYKHTVDDKNNAYLTFSTVNPGLNAIYERSVQNGGTGSSYTMNQIASKYNVNGLGTVFFKNDRVEASQYVKLLVGLRSKADSIDLTSPATSEEYTKAKNAGIYVSTNVGSLTKEQALAGVVKLYELNTGTHIKPSNVRINGTSNAYKEAVGKAYAIGLIEDIQPQQKITYEELCDWLVQVVE